MKELKATFLWLLEKQSAAVDRGAMILRLVYIISKSVEGKTGNKENSASQ